MSRQTPGYAGVGCLLTASPTADVTPHDLGPAEDGNVGAVGDAVEMYEV